ncbi:MAG: DnaJ domain-containing protein [Rickettsiales bacterium]|jgi:hypothetical protein|nr:DnaJ domain-containing protein [Rickettsiales bacterium]
MKSKKKGQDFTCRICDFEGCKEEGLYPAPKKNSNDYYYFCKKHVAEYNKNWNYYKDMEPQEVYQLNDFDLVGRRRTYRTGVGIDPELLKNIDGLEDPMGILRGYNINFNFANRKIKTPTGDPQLDKALAIMGLSWPITKRELSAKYKELSKKFHPDLTGGDKEKEEKFKIISASYNLISKSMK